MAVDSMNTTFKQFIMKFQEKMDEAVADLGMSEGTYMELCKLTKDANTNAKSDLVSAKIEMFAEMAMVCPMNVKLCSLDFAPWEPNVISRVFEMAKRTESTDHWWSEVMDEYVDLIFDIMAEYDIDAVDRMNVMRYLVKHIEAKTHSKLCHALEKNSQCFICPFLDEVDNSDLEDYATDVIANAPRLIVNLKGCECVKHSNLFGVSWSKLKWHARDCATDNDWEDAKFVQVVGPKDKKRKRYCASSKDAESSRSTPGAPSFMDAMLDNVRAERKSLMKMPAQCAVSLTFANRGENEKGMEIIGGPPSKLVNMDMLKAAKMQWTGEAELYDLSAMVDPDLVSKNHGGGSGILVLRQFAQRLLGEDAPDHIEHELELQKQNGKIDTKALMRGQVKNKNARHNNVMAHFDQASEHAAGKGTVVKIKDYPFINALTSHAAMWMQQDNPLICEQNRYFDVKSCGIGWHGDAEREIVLGYRAGEATKMMPFMIQAYHKSKPVGPQTTIKLRRGDVYIMTSKAVGTDWLHSSKVTWRHAAGNPQTCSYVKVKAAKESGSTKPLSSAIRKR